MYRNLRIHRSLVAHRKNTWFHHPNVDLKISKDIQNTKVHWTLYRVSNQMLYLYAQVLTWIKIISFSGYYVLLVWNLPLRNRILSCFTKMKYGNYELYHLKNYIVHDRESSFVTWCGDPFLRWRLVCFGRRLFVVFTVSFSKVTQRWCTQARLDIIVIIRYICKGALILRFNRIINWP